MSLVDDLLARVATSTRINGPTRAVLTEFLTSQRATLDALPPAAAGAFFDALQRGEPAAAWDVLVARMGQDELLALLQQTQAEVADLAAARAQHVAAYQSLIDGLGQATLQVAVQALLTVL